MIQGGVHEGVGGAATEPPNQPASKHHRGGEKAAAGRAAVFQNWRAVVRVRFHSLKTPCHHVGTDVRVGPTEGAHGGAPLQPGESHRRILDDPKYKGVPGNLEIAVKAKRLTMGARREAHSPVPGSAGRFASAHLLPAPDS